MSFPIIKRVLKGLLKCVIGIAIFVFAVYASVGISFLIWPSLSRAAHEPKLADFCGRYIPMPGTARLLEKKYPGAQVWLDIHGNGRIDLHGFPENIQPGCLIGTESAQWKFSDHNDLLILADDGSMASRFRIKGQEPPYIIESGRNDDLLEFCINPHQSSATRAYAQVSATDWVFQIGMVFCVLVLPFILGPGRGSHAFGYPFLLILVWGFWRMAYFDAVMHNDVIGMAYLVSAFVYALIARVIYSVRCSFLRRRSSQNKREPDQVPLTS